MNIGDVVKYEGDFGATKVGKIGAIGSDKDSYNDVTLKDGVFLTYSKKLKKYVPIKGKSLASVYIEICLLYTSPSQRDVEESRKTYYA